MRISDWSSDVCSSDLLWVGGVAVLAESVLRRAAGARADIGEPGLHVIGRAGAIVVGPVAQRGGGEVAQRAVVDLGIRRGDAGRRVGVADDGAERSEEHTSELQSLMRISYAVFCLKKKTRTTKQHV